MDVEHAKCRECGRVFTPRLGEIRCDACILERDRMAALIADAVERQGKQNARDIAAVTGFSVNKVNRTLRNTTMLSQALDSNEACVRCVSRRALQGSTLCLTCRVELHKSLGDMAKLLLDDIKRRPKRSEDAVKHISTSEAIRQKRRRTGTHRFNPAPEQGKRYG